MKAKWVVFVGSMLILLVLVLSGCESLPATPEGVDAAPKPTEAPPDPPAAPPVPADPETPSDWQSYEDSMYAFRIAYPADWTYKSMDMGGPGMPEDWPVEAIVTFFPQSLSEVLNREGPPDPNAPPAVPPFNIEVCVGPLEQFRRAYPEPGSVETLEINGVSVTVERDTHEDFNTTRYVFTHPEDENIRVVLIDVISGFSERAKANPEYVDLLPRIFATFEFTEGQPSVGDPDPLEYQAVTIPEAGLVLEVPVSWEQRAPQWAWEPLGNQGQQVGVKWLDVQPPQEVEAALLPTPSQIVESEEVDLAWAKGRSFTLEVYGPTTESGDSKAPIVAMEQHVIVVVEQDSGRRAYDFYASAKTAEQLAVVKPVFHQMLASTNMDRAGTNPLDKIRFEIASRLGVDANNFDLVLAPAEFSDACLENPAEDEMCAQMLTPGYKGQVKVGDTLYEVRANQDGTRVELISRDV